jgi:hypothetical protein
LVHFVVSFTLFPVWVSNLATLFGSQISANFALLLNCQDKGTNFLSVFPVSETDF